MSPKMLGMLGSEIGVGVGVGVSPKKAPPAGGGGGGGGVGSSLPALRSSGAWVRVESDRA